MKLWITHLNGVLVTAANYEPRFKKDNDDSLNSSIDSQNDAAIDQKSQKEIGEMKLNDSVKSVINHSRTLSLSLYQQELIYCKFQGSSFYYRAKHNLLFIFVHQAKQSLDLSVDSIDSIILKTIKYYESVCESIRCNYKLPRMVSNYQKSCLEKISDEIIEIIIDQKSKDLYLPQLEREQSSKQEPFGAEIKNRIQEFDNIDAKNRKIRRQPSLFERYTVKNVNRYKLKLCFLIVLVAFIIIVGSLIIYYSSSDEILV